MHALGEGLGETVGERLRQDLGVVVIGPREALGDRLLADAGGDGEAADIVGAAARHRRDEVGERDVAAPVARPRHLLAEREQARPLPCPRPRRR